MSQWEAWLVTALGMGVVYIGLVACIAFIELFGRLSRHIRWGEEGQGAHGGSPASVPEQAAVAVPSEPVPPDVLAVIALVLELERKLYMNRPGARVTIRRHTPAV